MTNTKDYVERIVSEKTKNEFSIMDKKLKNSFEKIKQDNLELRQDITNLKETLKKINLEPNKLREEINSLKKNLAEKEIEIKGLKHQLSKKNLKAQLKKEILKELEKTTKKRLSKQDYRIKKEKRGLLEDFKTMKTAFRGEIDEQNKTIERIIGKIKEIESR